MKDLTGQRFGRLTVIEKSNAIHKEKRLFWICRCSCGNITEVSGHNLMGENTKSCGCLKKEKASENGYKENLSIDRINNDGNYCPKNCRWITISENARKMQIDKKEKNSVKCRNNK